MTEEEKGDKEASAPSRVDVGNLLDALPDTVLQVDRSGRIVARIAGPLVPPFRTGVSFKEVLSVGDAGVLRAATDRARESGCTQQLTVSTPSAEGTKHYDLRVRCFEGGNAVLVLQGVDSRVRLERRRGEFISRISHDLRTPLTTMLLMADLLRDASTEDERVEHLSVLRAEAQREQALIERLLRVGRLEAGAMRMTPVPTPLTPLLLAAVSSAAPEAADRGLRIDRELAPDLPLVLGDAAALQTAFAEMLTNAIRFTPRGGEVRVATTPSEGGICVQVRDTGIGIPAVDLPLVWEPYFRGSNVPVDSAAAAGVGLAIVRLTVEAVGGRVRIDSAEGRGTTVGAWLPAY